MAGYTADCQPRDECAEDPAYQITIDKITALQLAGKAVKDDDWKSIMEPPQKLDSGYSHCYEIARNNWYFGSQFVLLPLCQNEEPSYKFVSPERVTNASFSKAPTGFSCTCLSSERKREEYDDNDFAFTCGDPVCHCPPEFACVRGSCECPDGLIKYLDETEGKTTCVERECNGTSATPAEIQKKAKSHLLTCRGERWTAVPGYKLIRNTTTEQVIDVTDIDECSESPSICCSSSANCTGPMCVTCHNVPGSYECLVRGNGANKTGICEADKIKKETCECSLFWKLKLFIFSKLKCTDQQSWYWSCISECRAALSYDFSAYPSGAVCTRFRATTTDTMYTTLPTLKAMYDRICASKMEISNKFGCLYDTNAADLTKSPVFNYWGPCLTASSMDKINCSTGSPRNISSSVYCPLNVSQDYPINIPISQPIGLTAWPKPRSCEASSIDFFKKGAWRITETSNSAAIIDLKGR